MNDESELNKLIRDEQSMKAAEEQKFMNEAREIREAEIRRMGQDEDLAAEMEADAQAAMFDNDPNPYHGDFSED